MNNIAISVIIPTHNNADTILDAVGSCFSQDFDQPFEVVLLADACTDDTVSLIKNFQKTHNNLVMFEVKNKSALKNRIEGARKAKGEYLMFLDGDDAFVPHAFKTLYNAIKKSDADMVNASFYIKTKKRTRKYAFNQDVLLNRNEAIRDLFKDLKMRAFMTTKIFKRELFLKIEILDALFKFDVGNFLYEDLLTNFYYFLNVKKVRCIQEPVYIYNKTNENSSTSSGYRRVIDHAMVKNMIRFKIEQINDPEIRKYFIKSKFRTQTLFLADKVLAKFPNKDVRKTIISEARHDFKNAYSKKFDVAKVVFNQLIKEL